MGGIGDGQRRAVEVAKAVKGTVKSDGPLQLRLAGAWAAAPLVTIDGIPAAATLAGGVLSIAVPTGTHTVVVGG